MSKINSRTMTRKKSSKSAKINISKAEVRVRELSQDEYSKIANPSSKPLYCVTIDEEIVKTPNGSLIVFSDKRAMQELAAEIDYSDELDVQKLSLYSLLSTQIDMYGHQKLDLSDEQLQEILWNDPVLRPVAGPEAVEQFKYLQVIIAYLSERNIKYISLPQITYEYSQDYLNGYSNFETLLKFVKSNIEKMNVQQITVFANCIIIFNSPILGLMLAQNHIDSHEFAVTYLTMLAINSKIWEDTDRADEKLMLDKYTKQAEIMVRYLRQFTPKSSRALNVFLCHSSGDKEAVRKLYSQLAGEGWIDPWLDEVKLLPGADWDLEIRKAVRTTDAVIVVLTKASVTKEGYVQKELKQALDVAEEKPEGMIYIIPVKLEDCNIPQKLSKFQWANLYFDGIGFNDYEYSKLLSSLQFRASSIGITLPRVMKASLLHQFTELGNRLRNLLVSRASMNGMSNAATTEFPNVLVFLRDTGAMDTEEYFEIDQLDKLYFEILQGDADFEQELTPRMVSRLESIVSVYEETENDESEYSGSIKENIESIIINSALLCENIDPQIATRKIQAQLLDINDRLLHVDNQDPFNSAEFARRRIDEFNRVTGWEFTEHDIELIDFFLINPEQLPVWLVFEQIYNDSFEKEWEIYRFCLKGQQHVEFKKEGEDVYKQINEWTMEKAERIYKVTKKNFPDVSPKMYSIRPIEF